MGGRCREKPQKYYGFDMFLRGLIAAPYAASPLPPLGYLKASMKYIGS
jgi:hypothetical protein